MGSAASDDGSLPFLLKILSVAKALSIQAHPDKPLAERLHADRPEVYKDDNHKPEMAIALTPFEAMCRFRPAGEIAAQLRRVQPLRGLCGGDEGVSAFLAAADSCPDGSSEECRDQLRKLFTQYMQADAAAVEAAVGEWVDSLSSAEEMKEECDALALRLQSQYPGDVGVFAPYWLNYIQLQPGQAMFLAANEPHAYLSGDIVECMACSDNVVRAGLTPKYKDVDTLCSMLTYNMGPPELMTGDDVEGSEGCRWYTPPVPEFQVLSTNVAAGGSTTLPSSASAAIAIVLAGSGKLGGVDVAKGDAILIPADGSEDMLHVEAGEEAALQLFVARPNEHM
eukprot:PLAT12760.1.p1 GENE.PLAT12760.1~~PLAT12760.1.p1  ORF type:complete len:353 (+),score=159.17 PLAT12760.1:47-1060(+)